MRELELLPARPHQSAVKSASPKAKNTLTALEDIEEPQTPSRVLDDEDDLDIANVSGLGGELDSALSGTTMTDLKLQVRKLQRELADVRQNQSEASRVLVLENLLEDANRMKARYEVDYLSAHREKLVLQNNLEEIRSGKALGNGYAVSILLSELEMTTFP